LASFPGWQIFDIEFMGLAIGGIPSPPPRAGRMGLYGEQKCEPWKIFCVSSTDLQNSNTRNPKAFRNRIVSGSGLSRPRLISDEREAVIHVLPTKTRLCMVSMSPMIQPEIGDGRDMTMKAYARIS